MMNLSVGDLSVDMFDAMSAPSEISLSHLTPASTLADLETHFFEVDVRTTGEVVAAAFKQRPRLPGVLVYDEAGQITAAISRRRFMEEIGRPYGVEVYLTRPIAAMVNMQETRPFLALPHTHNIHLAAETALNRPQGMFYEPVVVTYDDRPSRLLDVYTLLLAQSYLLTLFYQEEQNRRQLAESLQKTGRVLSGSLDLRRLTKKVLKELSKVVAYERGVVLTKNDREQLQGIASRGFPPTISSRNLRIDIHHSADDVFQRIRETQRPVIIDDVTRDPGWQGVDDLPVHCSWLGVPLIAQDRVIGMISLTREPAGAFTSKDADLVLTFAGQAAVALQNARLYERITTFNEQLEEIVDQRTDQLNRANAILEKMDRTKTDFIGVSAHELRTPLTVMKGYGQMLQSLSKQSENASVQTAVDGILTGVERMHYIVNNMLDVAKIDSETLSVYPEPVSVAQIMDKVQSKLHSDLIQRRLQLKIEALTGLPLIQGDPDLLQKVFYGLVVNAVKYTPDGGTITVAGRAILTHETEPAHVLIEVRDTGIGINVDQHELIFEKFYQTGELALHSSGLTKFKAGGPGLGLAIAKGIVEAHGGRIWVESCGRDEERYPGSTFTVYLPLKLPPKP